MGKVVHGSLDSCKKKWDKRFWKPVWNTLCSAEVYVSLMVDSIGEDGRRVACLTSASSSE